MKRFVKYVLTVFIFTGWMGAAQASLIFDFSFTNIANGGGVVSGEIVGLVNNSTGMATSVNILSNSGGFGIGSYISSINMFTVLNYQLTSVEFKSFGNSSSPPHVIDSSLRLDSGQDIFGLTHQANLLASGSPANFSSSLRSVPEPHTAVLVILGLAGLGFSRYKKTVTGAPTTPAFTQRNQRVI